MADSSAPQPARLPWPLWSCYVACSWTWLIGMFLPVILMHEFGWWAWVVFAVPNVIGAMSVGFVFRDPERSQKFVAAHRPAMLAFSWVTIAFHFFVMGWLGIGLPVMVAALVFLLLAALRAWLIILAALAVLAVSVVAGFDLTATANALTMQPLPRVAEGVFPMTWFWLACGTTLGFLTCPHMDLTLHRAAQRTGPRHGPATFMLGFGVLFVFLILLTAAYAPLAKAVLAVDGAATLPAVLPWLVALHVAVQAGYTASCHLRELPRMSSGLLIAAILGTILLAGLGVACRGQPMPAVIGVDLDMPLGDLLYRGWMGAYAVVFPAYVVLCVLPNRGRTGDEAKPSRKQLIVWLIACVVTLPMFALGFIGGQMVWVGVAVGLILLALVLVKPADAGKTGPPADA